MLPAGGLAGLVHGAVAVTVLFPVVLPPAHPRMALRDAGDQALVEAPGLLTLADGRSTPTLLLCAPRPLRRDRGRIRRLGRLIELIAGPGIVSV